MRGVGGLRGQHDSLERRTATRGQGARRRGAALGGAVALAALASACGTGTAGRSGVGLGRLLSSAPYSNEVAWTTAGVYATVLVKRLPLASGMSLVRVDPSTGGMTAVPTTRDPRCAHDAVDALDRLADGGLAYVSICRPKQDVVLTLGGSVGQAWRGTPSGPPWSLLTRPDVETQVGSQTWRPDLTTGLGQVGALDCSATVTLQRYGVKGPSAGTVTAGGRTWPIDEGARGSADCSNGRTRRPRYSDDGQRLVLLISPNDHEGRATGYESWRVMVATADLGGQKLTGPTFDDAFDVQWVDGDRVVVAVNAGIYLIRLSTGKADLIQAGTAIALAVDPTGRQVVSVTGRGAAPDGTPLNELRLSPIPPA